MQKTVYSLYSLFLNSSKEVYPKDEEEMCEDKILNGVILLKIVINYQKDPNKLEVWDLIYNFPIIFKDYNMIASYKYNWFKCKSSSYKINILH